MIAVHDLVKRYGTFTAVNGVSLEVQPGQIHGFLGPNGAGKTTLIKILTTLLAPTSGDAWVDGKDVVKDARAVRPLIALRFATPAIRTLFRSGIGRLLFAVLGLAL